MKIRNPPKSSLESLQRIHVNYFILITDEINKKFNELTEEDIRKYAEMKKSKQTMKKSEEMEAILKEQEMLTLVNVAKKATSRKYRALNKSASESK